MFIIYYIVFLICIYILNHRLSIYITHRTLIENREPLTDIIHSVVPIIDDLYLDICTIIHISIYVLFILTTQNKVNVLKITLPLMNFLYFIRLLTITSTQYPNARPCDKPIVEQYCGDMMFSGHALLYLSLFLSITSHIKIHKSIKYVYTLFTIMSLFLIVATRFHYTTDVVISMLLTILVWDNLRLRWRLKQ